MDIATLQLLRDVARFGSFAQVARQKGLEPSRISRQVSGTEDALGIRIFERSTRVLSLTAQGAAYLESIAPALDMLEKAGEEARAAHSAPAGHVRLSASVSFGTAILVPLLRRFRDKHPEISLELSLSDSMVDLRRDGMDLALRLSPAPKGDLVSKKLRSTRYYVCVSHDWDGPKSLYDPRKLSEIDCLTYALPDLGAEWFFQQDNRALLRVPVSGQITISNALALREAALAGLGPALLADWLAARDLRQGKLRDLLLLYKARPAEAEPGLWLITPSRRYVPKRVRAVVAFLEAELSERRNPRQA